MPDKWEYPWFAAWDLAFHCAALALVDVDFAKDQIELLLKENYLHPNGQIPAYEWAVGDVNPPVLAMAALKVFRAERVQRGQGDLNFLARVTHKMLMNYTWWLNRKDTDGANVFEGGFLGLDNISVYDRSQPLPPGYSLKQADSTGWMAMFALNMTVMALELAAEMHDYEDVAIQCYKQFMAIANSIAGYNQSGLSLWDEKDLFFKDLVVGPDGQGRHIDVFSWVGLIPLFAVEVIDQRLLANVPRFRAAMVGHYQGKFDGNKVTHCPIQTNARNEHLLSLLGPFRLKAVLQRVLDERQFLSPFGVRSVSRIHAERRDLGTLPGIGQALIEYVPGESNSGLFGGNSNWRGPIWMPTNYVLIQAIEKFYRYYGDQFTVQPPCAVATRTWLNACKSARAAIGVRTTMLYCSPLVALNLPTGKPATLNRTARSISANDTPSIAAFSVSICKRRFVCRTLTGFTMSAVPGISAIACSTWAAKSCSVCNSGPITRMEMSGPTVSAFALARRTSAFIGVS